MNADSIKNSQGDKSENTEKHLIETEKMMKSPAGANVSHERANKDLKEVDMAAKSFAEYLKNKVIERESRMSMAS